MDFVLNQQSDSITNQVLDNDPFKNNLIMQYLNNSSSIADSAQNNQKHYDPFPKIFNQ